MSKIAFVTGAAGQLGSALVEKLDKEGYEIIAFIKEHHDDSLLRTLPRVTKVVRGDLKNHESLLGHIPEGAIVFHCYSLSPRANATQEVYTAENKVGTQNLLRAAKEAKVVQFVYMSSCSVIGPKATPTHAIAESDPPSPNEPYGRSKYAAELEIRKFYDETLIPTLILRIFPLYGPRAHRNSTPVRLCKLLSQERFFMVGDGNNHYEFCFSRNAAEGIVLASQKIRSGIEIMNISEPVRRTYNEVINELAKQVNPHVKIVRIPKIPALMIGVGGEIAFKIFRKRTITRLRTVQGLLGGWKSDCSKEVSMLGYTQRYQLEDGCAELVEWVKKSKVLESEGIKLA